MTDRLETVVGLRGGAIGTPGVIGTPHTLEHAKHLGSMVYFGELFISYSSYVIKLVADHSFVTEVLLMQGVPVAILTSQNDDAVVIDQCKRLVKTMGLSTDIPEQQLEDIRKFLKGKRKKKGKNKQ